LWRSPFADTSEDFIRASLSDSACKAFIDGFEQLVHLVVVIRIFLPESVNADWITVSALSKSPASTLMAMKAS